MKKIFFASLRRRDFRRFLFFCLLFVICNCCTSVAKAECGVYKIVLRIEDNDNVYWDKLMIMLDNRRTAGKEQFDALKFTNPELNFYSYSSEGLRLSIDSRPYADGKIIGLGISTPYKKDYFIRVSDFGLPKGGALYLIDNYTHTSTILSHNSIYHFVVNGDSQSYGNRFALQMAGAPLPPISGMLTVDPIYPVEGQDAYTIYKGYGPQSINLTATISGTETTYLYNWAPVSNAGGASITVTPETTATYSVTITDTNGCQLILSQRIDVTDIRCGSNDYVYVCKETGNNKPKSFCRPLNTIPQLLQQGYKLGTCNSSSKSMNEIAEEFKIYPNPSNGIFYIQTPNGTKDARVYVVDMQGKIVKQILMKGDEEDLLDMTKMPDGVYMLYINSSGTIYKERIVVSKD